MNKNTVLALRLLLLVALMIGLSFASVPLYDLFCRVTGFGGTTQEAAQLPALDAIKERTIKVSFNADVQRDMPWTFETETPEIAVRLGDAGRAKFKVKNNSTRPITGIATYNVSPVKAGIYFQKIQCFCFEEHTLQPGETQEFPVLFFIDPTMDDDVNLKDINNLTLSYTYFESKKKN